MIEHYSLEDVLQNGVRKYTIIRKNKTHAILNNKQSVRLENIQTIENVEKNKNKSSVQALKEALKEENTIRKTKREGIFDNLNEEDIASFSKYFKKGEGFVNLFSKQKLYNNMSLEWNSPVIYIPTKMWVRGTYGTWKLMNTTTKTGKLSVRNGQYCVRIVPIDDKLKVNDQGVIYEDSRQGRKMAKSRKKKEKAEGDNKSNKKGSKKRKDREETEEGPIERPSDLDIDEEPKMKGEGFRKVKGKGFETSQIFPNKRNERINKLRFLA
eukprot:NODE_323_length_2456_cov_22.263814_g299_i0.p2 GENE.NODE_323_length_2456_cov_22.263814_g299_i0~~NODE_323_length_2456_cov_22.263814_g299_i0.p2  ORF type:complete len:268 (-),score=-38.18 NODE_323_length_2456_cov_22.263814_g299_i0:554-1357(-)